MAGVMPPATAPQQPPRPQGTSGLAIAALVLSLLFFIPLLPLIGAILGLVGLKRLRPGQGGRGMCIAAIPVGLLLFLVVQVLTAAISYQAFNRFRTLAMSSEARDALYGMRYGASDAAMQERVDAAGNLLPPGFPVGETGWTPAIGCCSQATRPSCRRRDADWEQQPWRALQFLPDVEHRYQYRYASNGRSVTLEARGDLDCDGVHSLFKMTGRIENEVPIFDGVETVREDE